MKLKYNKEDDILMIHLNNKKVDYAEQTGDLIVHFSPDREAVLLEILDATEFLSNVNNSLPKKAQKKIWSKDQSAISVPHRIK